jgi:hypothetical protein
MDNTLIGLLLDSMHPQMSRTHLVEEMPDEMEDGDFQPHQIIRVAASALYEIESDDREIEL